MSDVPGRLLRDTLQSRMSDESADCLDAGTLAAWADGTLSRTERGAAEGHAAGCARCQAMLAAMARTAPPAVARVWWHSSLAWAVPLGAAAAALLIWTELPPRARMSVPPSAVLQTNAAREVKAEAVTAVVAQAPASPPAPLRSRAERADSKRNVEANKDVAVPAPANAATDASDAGLAKPSSEAQGIVAAAEQALAPSLQKTPAGSAARASNLLLDARRQAFEIAIPSPNANSRWRITAAGIVQHSSDRGATWETQSTGVAATPTAGMSPSPSVCWLVGPRGLVLLSTDSRSWKRIQFPEMIDLTAVRAADERTATVTTSDGRAFTTGDGGTTWRQ